MTLFELTEVFTHIFVSKCNNREATIYYGGNMWVILANKRGGYSGINPRYQMTVRAKSLEALKVKMDLICLKT